MESNVEAERNHRKVPAAASSMAPLRKKELCCKYCNKKFTNYQALGGHQNAHKDERAAAQKEKILSMAAAYNKNSFVVGFGNSNQTYGFSGKTLGVSPLSMTRFKPHYSCPHVGLKHDYHDHVPWSGHQTLNHVQPTMHQLQTLIAEGSGFHQHHKPYQPLTFPTFRGGAPNSGSQSQLLINPSLCDKGNFGQASNSSIRLQNLILEMPDLNLNVKTLCDGENSGEANSFSSMPANGAVEELDLTLKI